MNGGTMNGSGSGGAQATGGGLSATGGAPMATRPLADLLAEPGWKGSTTPVCEKAFVPLGYDLWADDRGVFLLAKRECFGFTDHGGGCGNGAFSVWFNDGTGWASYYSADLGGNAHSLGGTPQGPVWILGAQPSGEYCDFFQLKDDGTGFCAEHSGYQPSTFFGLSANEAYSNRDSTILKYDGTGFEDLAMGPYSGSWLMALWANENIIYAASTYELFRKLPSATELEPLDTPGTYGDDIRALWGFGEQDLWLARGAGLYHFDGVSWSLPLVAPNSIMHLWGADGMLYVATQHDFGRVRDGVLEWFVNENDSERFVDMWGTSVDNVFLTVSHEGVPNGSAPCGAVSAYWFDGAKLHEF